MSFGPLFRPFNHPKLELANRIVVEAVHAAGGKIANPDWPRRIRNGDSLQAYCKNMLTELV